MGLQHEGAARRLLWDVSPIVDLAMSGWPYQLHVEAIAALQAWREGDNADSPALAARKADIRRAINDACQFVHTPTPARPGGTVALPCEKFTLSVDTSHAPALYSNTYTYSVRAADFAAWLTAQGESPSPLVALWFDAQGVHHQQPHHGPAAMPPTMDEVVIPRVLEVARERLANRPSLLARLRHESKTGMLRARLLADGWLPVLTELEANGHADPATVEARAVLFIDDWAARQSTAAVQPLPPAASARPVTAESSGPAEIAMTRAALVRKWRDKWKTIESDLNNASNNGLSIARTVPRGWIESTALDWARAKGKMPYEAEIAQHQQARNTMANLPSRRHTMDD